MHNHFTPIFQRTFLIFLEQFSNTFTTVFLSVLVLLLKSTPSRWIKIFSFHPPFNLERKLLVSNLWSLTFNSPYFWRIWKKGWRTNTLHLLRDCRQSRFPRDETSKFEQTRMDGDSNRYYKWKIGDNRARARGDRRGFLGKRRASARLIERRTIVVGWISWLLSGATAAENDTPRVMRRAVESFGFYLSMRLREEEETWSSVFTSIFSLFSFFFFFKSFIYIIVQRISLSLKCIRLYPLISRNNKNMEREEKERDYSNSKTTIRKSGTEARERKILAWKRISVQRLVKFH